MNLKNIFLQDDKQPEIVDEKEEFPSTIEVSSDDRTWGMLAHLSAFASFIIPFGHILGPLLVWYFKKDESAFVDANGKNSLNFQLSLTLYAIIGLILFMMIFVPLFLSTESSFMFGLFFVPFLIFLFIEFILVALACGRAYSGKVYKYPFTISFIK